MDALKQRFGEDMHLNLVVVDEIPLEESGKFRIIKTLSNKKMCGIAGIYNFNLDKIDDKKLRDVGKRIQHRVLIKRAYILI